MIVRYGIKIAADVRFKLITYTNLDVELSKSKPKLLIKIKRGNIICTKSVSVPSVMCTCLHSVIFASC